MNMTISSQVLDKPKLTISEQIAHLKNKGIKFELCSEDDALDYLTLNNNYFKIRAYRKNFEKCSYGEMKGKYLNLDFAMLKDFAIIDMRLRYVLLSMCLDIEHFEKVKLLRVISDSMNDGYTIVNSYLDNLDMCGKKHILENDINSRSKSSYCKGIINKYHDHYPAWAFVEILSFGQFTYFLKFCADYFNDNDLKEDYYLLQSVRNIRNAAAHNNCIINNLSLNTNSYAPNNKVLLFLSTIGISKDSRKRRMSNESVCEIVTLLYTHCSIVSSQGVMKARSQEIHNLIDRFFKNINFYIGNDLITTTFNFLKKVVDNLYPL